MKNNSNPFTLNVKTISFVVFASAMMLLFGCSPSLPKGELSIASDNKPFKPDADLASHKPFDVEVNKTLLPMGGPGYSVSFYQNENGKLTNHYGFWGQEEEFDKAQYAWLNDSTVSIRLYNSKSQKEVKFKVFGYGSTNGISTD